MLDDGSECKKEIHSIGFFFPLPPVPLSGEMDPSENPSTKSRQTVETCALWYLPFSKLGHVNKYL